MERSDLISAHRSHCLAIITRGIVGHLAAAFMFNSQNQSFGHKIYTPLLYSQDKHLKVAGSLDSLKSAFTLAVVLYTEEARLLELHKCTIISVDLFCDLQPFCGLSLFISVEFRCHFASIIQQRQQPPCSRKPDFAATAAASCQQHSNGRCAVDILGSCCNLV